MDGKKALGIIIIALLILSILVVGYSAVNKTVNPHENITQKEQILDESELNLTDSDLDSPISTVNLNINQKTGGSSIQFSDNESAIYKVISVHDLDNSISNQNGDTVINTNQTGNHLDINIDSNASENTIILSNKYNYNISGNFVAGGFDANLNNNSKIDEMNINATLGGISVRFNGGSLNKLNTFITTGGLNIRGEPNGVTTAISEIEIGGLDVELNRPVADIISNIDVGGINLGDYQQISENEYKGNEFDSSDNKLFINNTIKVGGVNTQLLPN